MQSGTPLDEVSGLTIASGRVAEAVGRLDGLVEELMRSTGIPGMAVAVVHDGKAVYAEGFGMRDADERGKVDAGTVFQLASLSKAVGATVVAHEVSSKVVGWDTPVSATLPWFALANPYVATNVTIADLYSHRSGLPDHAGDRLEDIGYDRRQVLERLRLLPLNPYRISYAYTNFGLTAAAEAVAVAAGKSWEELSDEVLYRPLGMTSTSPRFDDYMSRANRAVGHVKTPSGYQPLHIGNADAQSSAGGVSSSVNDMSRWLAMVMGNGTLDGVQIAALDALLPAITPQMIASRARAPQARASFYGYGFNVSVTSSGRTQYSHSGAFGLGASTAFAVLPSEDVGIIALTNAAPVGVPEALAAEFFDLIQYGKILEDWPKLYQQQFAPMGEPQGSLVGQQLPAQLTPARPLPDYVGEYGNESIGVRPKSPIAMARCC